ncbi:MAG: AAA family ATPase [Candidatus Methanodesulfokora washburnensis]|jgi:chromosome segregation ATPase
MSYIKEVILENFMSHEYSRIKLRKGLNLIIGPNGAGKSSIVVGISVALGQTYTERARRLRDLIRRGREIARVSVIFDNTPLDGKRPIPFSRIDEWKISRYIRADGSYWFEVDGRTTEKAEVVYMLSKLGINPDNMAVFMHQGMIEEFLSLKPNQILQQVEEAAGLHDYRRRVVEAVEKLRGIEKEEKEISNLMKRAEETLSFWRREYEKWNERKQLLLHRDELIRRISWAKFRKALFSFKEVERMYKERESEIKKVEAEVEEERKRRDKTKEMLDKEWSSPKIDAESIRRLEMELVEHSVAEAVGRVRLEYMTLELKRVKNKMEEARKLLEEARSSTIGEDTGDEDPKELEEELQYVKARIAALSDVSEETGEMYAKYLAEYNDLKEKLLAVQRNKEEVLKEFDKRMEMWKARVRELIDLVNERYKRVMEKLGGYGEVRLRDLDDIDRAGVEILASFGGSPLPVDSLSQSGGERSASIVSFLLALQGSIRSPIRVVDEFDVHMDPHIRERILREFVEIIGEEGQSIVITPGMIPNLRAHVIVVQKVSGVSVHKEV